MDVTKNGDADCRLRKGGATASIAGQEATAERPSCGAGAHQMKTKATEVAVAIYMERRSRPWGPSFAVLAAAKSAWTQGQSLPSKQKHRVNEMPWPTYFVIRRARNNDFEYKSKPI